MREREREREREYTPKIGNADLQKRKISSVCFYSVICLSWTFFDFARKFGPRNFPSFFLFLFFLFFFNGRESEEA